MLLISVKRIPASLLILFFSFMSTVIQQITASYFLILFSHFIADDENQHSFHLWKLLANGYTQTLKNTKNWKIPVNTLEPGKKNRMSTVIQQITS